MNKEQAAKEGKFDISSTKKTFGNVDGFFITQKDLRDFLAEIYVETEWYPDCIAKGPAKESEQTREDFKRGYLAGWQANASHPLDAIEFGKFLLKNYLPEMDLWCEVGRYDNLHSTDSLYKKFKAKESKTNEQPAGEPELVSIPLQRLTELQEAEKQQANEDEIKEQIAYYFGYKSFSEMDTSDRSVAEKVLELVKK